LPLISQNLTFYRPLSIPGNHPQKTGGIVPEVAARAHIQNILPVTEKALKDAKLKLSTLIISRSPADPD